MRRRALLALPLLAACKRTRHPNPDATIEDQQELASSVNVADPRDAAQLLSGFYELESNAWRWTDRRFSVSLAGPRAATERGGRLTLSFVIPDIAAPHLAGVTISALIDDKPRATFKAAKPGDYKAVFHLPPDALRAEAVIVDFSLDRSIPPAQGETRSLGLIVSAIALEPQ